MKTLIKVSALTALISLFCAQLAGANTELFSEIAEEFFIDVRAGNKEAVSSSMSAQWRSSMKPDVFERFLNVLGLDDYQSASWLDSEIIDAKGQLKGEFSSSDKTFPVTLTFVQQEGKWLVHGISVSPSTPPVKLPVPDYDAAVELVTGTMQAFASAVNARDMSSFYNNGSETFRIRHSVEEIEQAFGQYYGTDDFSERVAGVPGLAKPTLKDGYLIIEGGYLAAGYKTGFKLDYVSESGVWKIIGIGISSNAVEVPAND
jgi:hypothetical protein